MANRESPCVKTYEGGFGQTPGQEAQGGTTYCSVAALNLVADVFGETMAPDEREGTIRWLIQRQTGGFQGRTEKEQDACYSFWCGAALQVITRGVSTVLMNADPSSEKQILGASDLVDADANAEFIGRCQFKFGGIAKMPGERPGACNANEEAGGICQADGLIVTFRSLSHLHGLGVFITIPAFPGNGIRRPSVLDRWRTAHDDQCAGEDGSVGDRCSATEAMKRPLRRSHVYGLEYTIE